MVKERPIIFSGPMIRAILEDRKTHTRRVVNWPIKTKSDGGKIRLFPRNDERNIDEINWLLQQRSSYPLRKIITPYGQPGDRLWVRETFGIEPERYVQPSLNTPYGGRFEEEVFYRADDPNLPGMKWKPSIHMPKKYARLWLEIIDIRVERVQDISEEDAGCEGVETATPQEATGARYKPAFRDLWDSINGKKPSCLWDENPWVWVVEFKRVDETGEVE